MTPQGKVHPNSKSAWGIPEDTAETLWEAGFDRVTADDVYPSTYERVGDDEERFYLVALKWGVRSSTAPVPDSPQALLCYVTEDATLGLERKVQAERNDDELHVRYQEDAPSAISGDRDEAGEIPESQRQQWIEVLEEAHGISELQQEATNDFARASEIDGSEVTR